MNTVIFQHEEKSNKVIDVWNKATNDVTTALQNGLDRYQPYLHDGGLRCPW